ncbi:MAG: RNA polymerase sigma factor [Pirellulaceae bacterium]
MDRHEFARQYQAIAKRLWLIAIGVVGNRADADDVVQEAALIAFRKRDSFRQGTSFSAWVSQIVRFCAANNQRKKAGRNTLTMDPASMDLQVESSEAVTEFDSLGDAAEFQGAFDDDMLRGLNQLSVEARSCLLLRVVDGLAYADIAELMSIPEGTAMSHVHRSKKWLRKVYSNTPGHEGGSP